MFRENFHITCFTKGNSPKSGELPFAAVKESILGKRYNLDLVFTGKTRARLLNKKYRSKDYAPDILSFPLGKYEGQIFICPEAAAKKARQIGEKRENYIAFLFIHGLLHLKGMRHGVKMEEQEIKFRKKFGI